MEFDSIVEKLKTEMFGVTWMVLPKYEVLWESARHSMIGSDLLYISVNMELNAEGEWSD